MAKTNEDGVVEGRSLDEVMKDTELGETLLKYKKIILSVLVVAIIGAAAGGFYSYNAKKTANEMSAITYDFSVGYLKDFTDKKIDSDKFVKEVIALVERVDGYEGSASVVVKSADLLVERKKLAEAEKVLSSSKKYFKSYPFVSYFILNRLAVVYEDNGKVKEAIKALENVLKSSIKLFEAKTYLDLGRLYIQVGDKDKAKRNLNYVIEKFTKGDFPKMAGLYLAQIEE